MTIKEPVTLAVRILHCGTSIKNYNLCIQEKVVGFNRRVENPKDNDIIYLAVKDKKKSCCGAKARLSQITDFKPSWENSELYVQCFTITDLEFCTPFELNVLAKTGGQYWQLRYIQLSKPIVDKQATNLLESNFLKNKIDHNYFFNEQLVAASLTEELIDDDLIGEEINDGNINDILKEIPEAKISIMGTFQTINFINETDKVRGLEALVNENFFSLFPQYPIDRTLLIPENKLFITSGLDKKNNETITGIRAIPDALLLVFNKNLKNPLQVNLIEYECFGEKRPRALDKFNYLNGHIIPQLMRFASTFSVVTDKQIREDTAKKWTNTIIHYIYTDETLQKRFTSWIREIEPGLSEQLIALKINNMLLASFCTNLGITLIIDELSPEQRETLKNVINSFKLENGESIKFMGYVVRLEQKINLLKEEAEFALSVQ